PAPYGGSCIGCVKAKCKCVYKNGTKNCERCLRLGRECQSPESTRKRKKRPNTLEAKVDGILSLLQAVSETPRLANGDSLAFRDNPASQDSTPSSFTRGSHINNVTPAPSDFLSNASDYLRSASYSMVGPSIEEAEQYLTEFRTQKLINFAFIYLSPNITIQQLRQERPFLFLTIMAVSAKSGSQRLTLGKEIKNLLSRELLFNSEGNFDVLLGMLVFITWGHDQFVHTQLTSRFMQLAMSMVFDLRLNKSPLKEPFFLLDISSNDGEKGQEHHSARSMEERRAVLACFVLSSLVSWYFEKIDALRWTPYMDDCLLKLISESECSTDEIFAHQVQLQLIVHKVSELSNAQSDTSQAPKTPLPFYLKAFRSQLLEVQRSLSPEAECNEILQAYIHRTNFSINALALSKEPLVSNTTNFTRLDCLSTCLASLKSWFGIFFTIPPSQFLNLSFPYFSQLVNAIVLLHRLSTFEDPAWDRGVVKETIDILVVLERLIGSFKLLQGECKEVTEAELFGKMAMVFEWVRNLSKTKLFGGEEV
ncbi:hypothetical protein N431DRAFT_289530, partial [Stipitochalara longipes BDJ]